MKIAVSCANRTSEGQRRYDNAALERLIFVRHAQKLRFELNVILDAHEITHLHLQAVKRRLAMLLELKMELSAMLKRCEGGAVGNCRVIEILCDHRLCKAQSHR